MNMNKNNSNNKNNNNKNNNNNNKKPFCKVCQDAGKTESEYTSHFVKSDKGIVICPTLLEVVCRYCSKQGHTIKFCPTIEQNKKEDKKHAFKAQKEEKEKEQYVTKKSNKKTSNLYASLCDDTSSDEESNKKTNKKTNKNSKRINNSISKNKQLINNDDFPELSVKQKHAKVEPLAFKNIIKLTQEQEQQKREAKEEREILERLNEKKFKKEEIKVIASPDSVLQSVPKRYTNWADAETSDDEDDYEEKEYYNPYDSD